MQLYGLLAGYQADSLSNIVGWPLSIEGKYLQIVDQLILPEITISSDIKHCFMLYFRTKYNIRPATAESKLNIHIHMFLVFYSTIEANRHLINTTERFAFTFFCSQKSTCHTYNSIITKAGHS